MGWGCGGGWVCVCVIPEHLTQPGAVPELGVNQLQKKKKRKKKGIPGGGTAGQRHRGEKLPGASGRPGAQG